MGRTFRIIAVAMLGALCGCVGGTSQPPAARGGRAETAPTSRNDGGAPGRPAKKKDVMAYVNGKALYMDELFDLLLRGRGRIWAEQLVRMELVSQALAKAGLALTDDDVEAELQSVFKLMMPPQVRTRAERMQVLNRILAKDYVPYEQFLVGVKMSASLRKLAEPRVKVDDDMLDIEFGRMYGRQVVVRIIEVESLTKAQEILAALKAGKDFSKLAWQRSIHDSAKNYGLLDPISAKNRNVPAAIRQTALSLKKKGHVSDLVQVEGTFFILKLEKSIAPKNVKFEDVKDKITTSLRARLLRLHQKAVLDEIEQDGKVEYVNRIIKRP